MKLINILNKIKQINPEIKFKFKGEFDDNNKRTGYWEYYFDNGKVKRKGNYLNGKKDGNWEHYYENGNISFTTNYLNGVRHGRWEFYWSNGDMWYKGYI